MNLNELKTKIENGGLSEEFDLLYGSQDAQKSRYLRTIDGFKAVFGDAENIRVFSAPGRTEVGGNHTDHQHGCVLTGAVDLDVIGIVSPANNNKISIKSEGYKIDIIDLDDLNKKENEVGHAAAIIRGVIYYVAQLGYKLSGLNVYTTSNVFSGSGLSSSAAFETLVGNILNGMFCDKKLDAMEIAKIGQKAERNFFGKPCGLLDQTASSVGGFAFVDFFNPETPKIEKITLDIAKFGYTLCVINTGGDHADLTADYAAITDECKQISNYLNVDFLRHADVDVFYKEMASIRQKFGDRAVLRAIHFFNENDRALAQKEALKTGDFKKFLRLVNESGDSSFEFLQNLYSPSKIKEQGLCLAIAITKKFLNGDGACRVHGGGFAGTVQCYIPTERMGKYKKVIENVFGAGSLIPLMIRPVGGYEIKL